VGTDMACLCRVRPAGVHVHGVQLCPRARAKATRTCDAPCSCRAPTCLRARGMHARPVAHRPPASPAPPVHRARPRPAERHLHTKSFAPIDGRTPDPLRTDQVHVHAREGRGGDGRPNFLYFSP
jgi:hypothetical protein